MERMVSTTVGTFLILLYTLAILLNSFVLGAFVKHGYQSYFMRKVVIASTSQNIFAAGLSLLLVSIWMCNPDILVHPSTTCKLILLTVTLVLVQLSATTFVSMVWMVLSIKQPLRVETWGNSSIMQWSYITVCLFSVIYLIPIGANWIISNQTSSLGYCSIDLVPFPFACFTVYCIIIPPKLLALTYELYLYCIATKIMEHDNKLKIGKIDAESDRERKKKRVRFVISEVLDFLKVTVEILCWCLILHCPECVSEYQLVVVLSFTHGISFILCLLFGLSNQFFRGPILKTLRDVRTFLKLCEKQRIDIIE